MKDNSRILSRDDLNYCRLTFRTLYPSLRIRVPRWLQRTSVVISLLICPIAAPTAEASSSAVVVTYHRFGEPDHPHTNISLEQFEDHIIELAEGPYTVLPLPEIIDALRAGRRLPDRAVALTIDDAYLSVYTEAWPRLRALRLPFTLFVSTDVVDHGVDGYMTWDQIRELAADGVTIGSQTASHLHMPAASDETNRRELEASSWRIAREVGRVPTLFAYPYGESSVEVKTLVQENGFVAAFGQHSGAFGADDDLYALPRFPMNETYGNLERFITAVNALPIPTREVTPKDDVVREPNPPAIGFTVPEDLPRLAHLRCYASRNGGGVDIERLGPNRIEVRLGQPFKVGRNRLNCTMPSGDGRWRWWGRQFVVLQ